MSRNFVFYNVIVNANECEGSISEANDCLRSVWGKLEWFDRKQRFCPHLISTEDTIQVKFLIDRLTFEESAVMEYENRLNSDQELDISMDLRKRVKDVCDLFRQIKELLYRLYNDIDSVVKNQSSFAKI